MILATPNINQFHSMILERMEKKYDYYTVRVNQVKAGVEKEIEFYESLTGIDRQASEPYLEYLRARLGRDRKPLGPQVYYDGRGVRREVETLDMETYGQEVDEMVYQKDWKRMREFHRIIKIGEYVDGLEYPEETPQSTIDANRKKIKEEIIAGLRSKKFCKGKAEIDYHKEEMCIKDISSVSFSKSRGIYRVRW